LGAGRIKSIRKWQQHGLSFASGFVAGYINLGADRAKLSFGTGRKFQAISNHFAISAIGYSTELGIANWARSRDFPNGWYDSGWEQKVRIIGMKDLIQSLVAH